MISKKTPIHFNIIAYKIIPKGGMKIVMLGLVIELKELVLESCYGNTKNNGPIEIKNRLADYLRKTKKCDYIIPQSYIGDCNNYTAASDNIHCLNPANIDFITSTP